MEVKLIYPGRDTKELVKTLIDEWTIVGPIRAAIFLSNAWHKWNPQDLVIYKDAIGKGAVHYSLNNVNIFGPNEQDNPWSRWVSKNTGNYSWMLFYAQDLCEDYLRRFPHLKRHGITTMLSALENMPESLPEGDWEEPFFSC